MQGEDIRCRLEFRDGHEADGGAGSYGVDAGRDGGEVGQEGAGSRGGGSHIGVVVFGGHGRCWGGTKGVDGIPRGVNWEKVSLRTSEMIDSGLRR